MLNVFLDIFAHSPVDYARVTHVCSFRHLTQFSVHACVFQSVFVQDRITDEMA